MDATVISGTVQSLIMKLGREIKNQITYLCCHHIYIQGLDKEVQKLEIERQTVQQEVDIALRNLKSIRPNVIDWLTRVDDWLVTSHEILDKARSHRNSTVKIVFLKWLPMIHYSLSLEAKKAINTSIQLQITTNKLHRVSYPSNPANLQSLSLYTSDVLLDSRALLEKQVMEALEDDSIYLVGLCGMGGIGKTTMATKMVIWAKNSKIFEVIIFIVVSQKLDIKEVQQQIAEGLGLKLKEHSPQMRAAKIHTILNDEKSFLIVFDDVWERLDLAKIGIPSKSSTKRRKLILTSRIRDALLNLTSDDKIFTLDILSDQDAWKLFRERAGDSIESPELAKIAKQVAKKCKGLPLPLVVVGSALNDKSVTMWEDALVQLNRSHIPSHIPRVLDDLYAPFKRSYEQLPSAQVKYIFLLCCLFCEDYEIPTKSLVRYGWASHVFDNIETIREARHCVSSLVDILKCRFLLTKGEVKPFFGTGESVRVHDVIREMGISIACEDRYAFIVSEGNWPRKSSYENISHIYVELNGEPSLPETLNCPRLEFLHIGLDSDFEGEIAEEFFSSSKGLKVLSACYFKRKKLPSSISKLINLKVIHLKSCLLGSMESIFGNMVHLEIICLQGSSLDVLPREIGQLKNLKVLDLTWCEIKLIEYGVISKLVKLEELLMQLHRFWHFENEAAMMILEEIASLHNLVNLQINIQAQKLLSLNTPFLQKLWTFVLKVQLNEGPLIYKVFDRCALYNKVAFFECMEVFPISNFLLSMIRNVEFLVMEGDGCIGILNGLLNTKFEGLKYLQLAFFEDEEYLVAPKNSSQSQIFLESRSILFPTLESLILRQCKKLKEICRVQPCIGSFGTLKKLDLLKMKVLEHAIPMSKFHICSHLEVLKIKDCPSMEHIFVEHEREDHIARAHKNKIIFLRLCKVVLSSVPIDVFCKDMEEIEFPSLAKQQIINLPMATFASMLNYNINDEQFFFNKKIICPKLKVLLLVGIRSNGIFNHNIPEGFFDRLLRLEIIDCKNLKNVMAHSVSKSLKNLKVLTINYCEELEEVIMQKNSEKDEEISQRNNNKEILFPQLQELILKDLPKMYTFCHISTHIELPSSLEVTICNCPLLNTFSLGSIYCPKIKVLQIQDPDQINKIFQISP